MVVPGLVSHLRDALMRDGVVAEAIASQTEKVETIPELPPIKDPLKDVLVDVVENQKFLMEYLLVSFKFFIILLHYKQLLLPPE